MLTEVVLRVNAGYEFRLFIDPENDEDLRYFWRRFQGFAESAAQRNTGGRAMLEVNSVMPVAQAGYGIELH